jgi:hypothetical protein
MSSAFDDLLASNNGPESVPFEESSAGKKAPAARASRATTKAPGAPPPASSKLSAKTVKYFNENMLPKLRGDNPEADLRKAASKRNSSLQKIYNYYQQFPYLVQKKEKEYQTWAANADQGAIDLELHRIQTALAAPSAQNNLTHIVRFGCMCLERASVELLPSMGFGYDYNMSGLTEELFRDPNYLAPELKELSVVWQDWLIQGPHTRLLLKVFQGMMAVQKARGMAGKALLLEEHRREKGKEKVAAEPQQQ